MVGNVWEFVADWTQAGPTSGAGNTEIMSVWGTGFGADATWNISGEANNPSGGLTTGLPAMFIRGGYWASGTSGGAFDIDLGRAPSNSSTSSGARCCR